jgi:hypothetical protein
MPRAGFNANEKAAAREEGPVTLGEVTYHPARLTNAKMRQVRSLSRQAGIEARKAAKESSDYADAYAEAKEDGLEEEEAKRLATEAGDGSDVVSEINNQSLARQLCIMLRDVNAQPVTEEVMVKHLSEDIDARDIGDLMDYLLGGGDPTPTPTEGTTTS